MGSQRRQTNRKIFFGLLCALLPALAGCGKANLSYRLSPREGKSFHVVDMQSGIIETNPEGKEVETLAPTGRSYIVAIEPTQKRSGKTWMKVAAEVTEGRRPVEKMDVGLETLVMDRFGNFDDRIGISLPFETELILPPLPGRIGNGQSWTAKRTKKTGNTRQQKDWNFKYLGRGEGKKKRCQMISLNVAHLEETERQMPNGPKVIFRLDYDFSGDICFWGGRVRQADYLELITLTLSASGASNIAMQKKEFTRYNTRWTKEYPGKKQP